MIELLHMDCMEYLRECEDNAFDIAITSPPYNMNLRVNAKGDGYCSRQVVKELSSKYENYADNMPMEEYKDFLSLFISESCRVSDLVFLNIQQITGNKRAIYQAISENIELLKETIIWDKCIAQPSIAERTFNSQFEFIYVFGGNAIARQFQTANFSRGTESNIWRIRGESRKDLNHGARFPLAIPAKILNLFGRNGMRVIDPFLGTGTTAIAAHYGGFDFTGIELDEDYYNTACTRFDQETAQQAMDI